jgi:tryptophanyl-tRNA synthetase
MHLGNFIGAVRRWVDDQPPAGSDAAARHDALFCVVDLHAMTMPYDPAELTVATRRLGTLLLACGLDPERCLLFVQSHVRAHAELTWLLNCTATYGELQRMTQFKEKSEKGGSSVGLFDYPVLMAADILLYDTDEVPVGDDQRQHLELARELANRFNNRYGETFVVPRAAIPGTAARVMDLQHPERKMSKSVDSPLGTIGLLDSDDDITRKVRKAVTDTDGEVRFDPEKKPGLANLLELLAAATNRTPAGVAADYSRYGDLKNDVATALVELLRPIRERRLALEGDLGHVNAVLARGAARAHEVATATYARAADAMGLLPPTEA